MYYFIHVVSSLYVQKNNIHHTLDRHFVMNVRVTIFHYHVQHNSVLNCHCQSVN